MALASFGRSKKGRTGHSYSVLALLPEREAGDAPWIVPLSCERVPTDKTAREVACLAYTQLWLAATLAATL